MFANKNRRVSVLARLWAVGWLAIALTGCASTPTQEWPAGKVFGELAYQKQRGEELASRVQRALQPSAPEYQEAESLYGEARLRYNAYGQQLSANYIANISTDLSATASSAASASEAFRAYVVKNVPSRGVDEAVGAANKVSAFGFGMYEKYLKDSQERRRAAAAEIQPQIQWRAWTEITQGANPPAH